MNDVKHFSTADGLSLAYSDTGHGIPLLCLAGLTRNMADFDPVAAHFASRARVIRLDSRGRGASDWAEDFTTYSVPQESADAIALLDHLGLDRAVILGTSRGGLIAMTLAATERARLAGVILNDIGPVLDPAGLAVIADYIGRPPAAASIAEAAEGMERNLRARFPGVPRATWEVHARRLFVQGPDGLELRYDPRLRDAVMGAFTGPAVDLWPLFDALEGVPLAMLRGANSDLLSPGTFAEMQARRPDAMAATVPDRGHVPFLDEPVSMSLIAAFLESLA